MAGFLLNQKKPELLAKWYKEHLGVDLNKNNDVTFKWSEEDNHTPGLTILSFFKSESDYFNPSESNIMLNFRVKDLNKILAHLNTAGYWVAENIHYDEHGSFGWTMDPDGNKIELWEPKAQQQ